MHKTTFLILPDIHTKILTCVFSLLYNMMKTICFQSKLPNFIKTYRCFQKSYLSTKDVANLLNKARRNLVSLDCEFIKCVGNDQTLARCSIVDYKMNVIDDFYVKPTSKIICCKLVVTI